MRVEVHVAPTCEHCFRVHGIIPLGKRVVDGRDDWAVIDYQANRVVQCGPGAWRHLAWQALDAEGRINSFPVEIEGPLPIKEF